jgi:hypothetical protein
VAAKRHQQILEEAIAVEGEGQRALLAGDDATGRARMADAAELYRTSWQEAPPRAFGRLVGMLKAAVIAGDAGAAAIYTREELGDEADSPASWYAIAVAALVEGDDELAERAAGGMEDGSPAFGRTARAIRALARHDADEYASAVEEIIADFAARDAHLTGVPIADTALMLERLAEARGMAARPRSPLLPG